MQSLIKNDGRPLSLRQPFAAVAADGYEVLHGLGQVFILVVYQSELALEFKARHGEFDQAARFDFVLHQAAGQDGYA